MNHSCWN